MKTGIFLTLLVFIAILVSSNFLNAVELSALFTGLTIFAIAPVIPFIDNSNNTLYDENGGPLGSQARTGEVEERSKIAEADIKMGYPVMLGTTGAQVKPLASGTTHIFGIAKYNPQAQGFAVYALSTGLKYLLGEACLVLTEGVVWVWVEEAVDEKSPVRVRITNHASDATKLQGMFGTTADEDKTCLVKGAYFASAQVSATGGPVMLRLTDSNELVLDNLTP